MFTIFAHENNKQEIYSLISLENNIGNIQDPDSTLRSEIMDMFQDLNP